MTGMRMARGRRTSRVLAVAVAAGGLLLPAAGAIAAFTGSTTTATATYSTKRIYPHTFVTAPHNIRDASSGTEVNADDLLFDDDGTYKFTTGPGWPAAFDADRHLDVQFESSLPPGLAVTNPRFVITFNSPGSTTCIYVKVYRRSAMTLLGQTSPTSPSCVTPTSALQLVLVLSGLLSTTDDVNDLLLRVVVRNSAGDSVDVDQVELTGSTPYKSFVLHRDEVTDTSGADDVQPWALIATDGTYFTPATDWTTSFSTGRYVRFIFPNRVPSGASVTAVTLHHAFRPSSTGVNTCYYFDVLDSDGTVLATHGSSGTPYCNSGGGVVQDNINLPELQSPAALNGAQIKMYWRVDTTCACQSLTDLLTMESTYSLT